MKSLVIDIGNTRMKTGVFFENKLLQYDEIPWEQEDKIIDIVIEYGISKILLSNVSLHTPKVLNQLKTEIQILFLDKDTHLPFINNYKSKDTLGSDRKALVAGASHFYEARNCLIIDAGTCITYDLLTDKGEYLGGNISPGLQMRLQAMNHFTGKLPLPVWNVPDEIMGSDTEHCLLSGAFYGLLGEIQYFISHYEKEFKNLKVLLTGGDASILAKPIKKSIFVHEHLLLYGLNKILIEHVK
ncbi:MAG: type III pantothenate kinase [Bacteroidota bacterium]|nr:type III pantothenate kinase [Bacteroidota bacterium]